MATMTKAMELREQAKEQAEAFNQEHHVGVRVKYWPGVQSGEPEYSITRSPAAVIGTHTACVMVVGHRGCIALSHVEVIEEGNDDDGRRPAA